MKAVTNLLNCEFNYSGIDERYDIFKITTSKKYIENGVYLLDKPVDKLKALSLIFEPKSKSFFVLFKKGIIVSYELQNALESDDLSVSRIPPIELKEYLLLRLFLCSLGNYSSLLQFNNLTGRLFLTDSTWINKKKTILKAMEMTISKEMGIEAHAITFTNIKLLRKKDYEGLPRYSLGGANSSLKRITAQTDGEDIFVLKSQFGYKSNIDFLIFNDEKGRHVLTKSFKIYQIVDLLNEKFAECLTVSFKEYEIIKKIDIPSDKKFMDGAILDLRFNNIYLIDKSKSSEYAPLFDKLHTLLEKALDGKVIEIVPEVQNNGLNIIFIHNEEYYQELGLDDPYKKLSHNIPLQYVTIEDCGQAIEHGDLAVLNTILKELLIKDNILKSGCITLDNWRKYNFAEPFYFGCFLRDLIYFLKVDINGEFKFIVKKNDFSEFGETTLNGLSNILVSSELKGKFIIRDDKGNINVIGRTDAFTLPNKEIFKSNVSRGKEGRERYLSGVVDINFYKNGYYSVGLIGKGMETSLPRASRIYKVDVIKGENIMYELLSLMSTTFVKLNEFTVIPYPFKYLREYIENVE